MNAVDDLDATITGWRIAARTLALGSLVLVAALSWQPLALLIDTMMHWPNIAMGLSQVALVACAAGSCVMITTVASGRKPAVTRRFASHLAVRAQLRRPFGLIPRADRRVGGLVAAPGADASFMGHFLLLVV